MFPPKELAAKLAEFAGDPLLLIADDRASLGKEDKETAAPAEDESPSADDELAFGKELRFDDEAMRRVFEALNAAGGVDFTHYKRPTIRRRLHRRMLLSRIQRIEDDIQMLEQTPSEVQKLFRDVLIHVTRFFRDPESFDLLKAEIFPKALARLEEHDSIRVWIAGCSTGEGGRCSLATFHEAAAPADASAPIAAATPTCETNAAGGIVCGYGPTPTPKNGSTARC